MKKKIFSGIILALVGLIILSMIMLPGIARRYAIKHSKALIGRQIGLDKLRLNYLTGKITVTDFKMYEANDRDEFASFDTLIVKIRPLRFFYSELVMKRFYMSGLHARVIQYDSTFNFDDLVEFYSGKEDTVVADTTPSEPFKFYLSNIEFRHSGFEFENRKIGDTLMLRDLSFFIPYIGWNQAEKSEAGLRFSFQNEGYFESSFNVDPLEGNFDANITINSLSLDAFSEYVAEYIKIKSLHGKFNSHLNIAGNINETEKSVIKGKIEIMNFSMNDTADRKFLGMENLSCWLKKIDTHNSRYIIDSVILFKPYVYFELDTNTNNFLRIFSSYPEDEDSTHIADTANDSISGSSDSLYYAVNYFAIRNGIADYRDNLTNEPFDYHLSNIELNADSIVSTSGWINIYSAMLLNQRGKLVAEVGLDPGNPEDIKLEYVITGFQLSDLNIYSRFYMGFPVLYGDMYYKSNTEIIDNQLKSENKLVIQNVELGNKSGGLYDLPIKFVLFLLKDRHGVINLDIPVRGDLNDPTVSVGKIIWNTVKNLIIKLAAAPYDLLAGLLSVDPKDIKAIEYNYLDTAFTPERQRQVDLLLDLEKKKEGLEIELVYFNDTEIEKRQIAVDEAGKVFSDKTGKDYLSDEKDFVEFLKSATHADSVDIAKASATMIPAKRIDSLALIYASTRRKTIEKYLLATGDSTQIRFFTPDPLSPKNIGSTPQFEVKYTMKTEED